MKVFYLAVFIFFSTPGVTIGNEKVTDIERYFLRVEMRGVIASISLNGAPIISSEDTDLMTSTEPLNIWLHKGQNILSYRVLSAEAEKNTPLPMISASLFLHDEKSEVPLAKKEIALINYNYSRSDHYPLQNNTVFEFSGALKTRLWQDAEELGEITQNDKNEIQGLIDALSSSVISGDIEKSLDLQKYMIRESALAEGHTFDALEKAVRSNFEWLTTLKDVSVSAYDKNKLRYTLCGANRLVYIADENNKDVLRFSSVEADFDIKIYMAKINGHWIFAR